MSESSHDEGARVQPCLRGSSPRPSYQRKVLSHLTAAKTSSPHVAPGRNKFVARPFMAGSQTNLADQVEGDEDFAEEEAVCKFCFVKVEKLSVIMMIICTWLKRLSLFGKDVISGSSCPSSHQRSHLDTTPPETLSPHAPRMTFVARPFPAGSQTNLADVIPGSSRPSSHQMSHLHTTPPETLSPHAPRMTFVARPFLAGCQTNLADQVEGDEQFAEEEAVCKFCFTKVGEDSVIMMTKCRCKCYLAHEECTSRWFKTNGNNCEVCAQEVNLVNCILLGSQKFHNEIQSNGSSFGSWLRRLSLCGKGK